MMTAPNVTGKDNDKNKLALKPIGARKVGKAVCPRLLEFQC